MSFSGVGVDGVPLVANVATGKSGGRLIGVLAYDPEQTSQRSRLAVRISTDPQFANDQFYYSEWKPKGQVCFTAGGSAGGLPGDCAHASIPGLEANTKYYVRVNIQWNDGSLHDGYTGSFYTNRRPDTPTLVAPADGASFDGLSAVFFDWTYSDPDGTLGPPYSVQGGYDMRYRTVATALQPAGPWVTISASISTTSVSVPPSNFLANSQYEWQVKVRDQAGSNSDWSITQRFYMGGTTSAPTLLSPINSVTENAAEIIEFTWKFRDPNQAAIQGSADLRWRVAGDPTWTTLTAVATTAQSYLMAADTFPIGMLIEWQMRTTNNSPATSDWSPSDSFYAVSVADDTAPVLPVLTEDQGSLGVGINRAFIYARGGKKRLGEIKVNARIQWGRKRDDISGALVTTAGWGEDDEQLLRDLRTWRHELVIFRGTVTGKQERVWEGPITRLTFNTESVEIEAKDVMAYVYRRILRQGYNEAYRIVNGVQQGLHTVIYRARAIIMNALGYDDPNVLPYLTSLMNDDDARTSAVAPPFSKTAWGAVDDMAATAGLDYTVVGRRIILVDTHRGVGLLPEMTDGDFSSPPVVTEYGMQAANRFAVTNNSGVWGEASRLIYSVNDDYVRPANMPPEGILEQLASAYGESDGAATSSALTAKAKAKLQATLRKQAERNISGRWPVPLVVRVPDNATLSPDVNLGINQLVPGVWIPIRTGRTLRSARQVQKLDSITVTQAPGQSEQIAVVMSPAPLPGENDDDSTGDDV